MIAAYLFLHLVAVVLLAVLGPSWLELCHRKEASVWEFVAGLVILVAISCGLALCGLWLVTK